MLEDFQAEVVSDLFAGYSQIWMIVPEGNGKTTLMAGLALYHADYTPSAEALVAASSRQQAQLLYAQAAGFVRRSPGMRERFRPYGGYLRVQALRTGGRIQVYAADSSTGDGVIPTLCLIDELHRHKDLQLLRTWAGKLGKRNGQLAVISTAGEPGSEFEETREQIRRDADEVSRDGCHVRAASDRLVIHDWAVPEGADVTDMAVVKGANPFSGVTVESLAKKHADSTMTPGHWRRFVCNLPTRRITSAITESEWDGARTDEEIPEGEPIAVGLDVGWKWDTTALAPWWESDRTGHRILDRARILTPPRDGTSLDPHLIEDAFTDLHRRNPIHTVVMDIERAEQLASWLDEEIGCRVVEYGNSNIPAALAYERFMEGLRCGVLRHTGDREARRHALNAVARMLPNGGARFDRAVKTRNAADYQDGRVIDWLIAAAMVNSALTHDEVTANPYEDKDLLVL